MRIIPLSRSLLVFLDDIEYLDAALSAHPLTLHLAPPVAGRIASWNGIFMTDREARREIIRANAVVAVRNRQVDDTTTEFAGELLVEVKQDRKSTFFRRFFREAPSEFIRTGLRDQIDATRTIILAELAKLPKDSRLYRFIEPLTNTVNAAAEALQRRIEVWSARSGVRLNVEDWKQGTNALRQSIYGELVKIAAANGYGRNWAETFFRPPDGDDEKEFEVPPPSPPAPPEA